MNGELSSLRLPELYKHKGKAHDPARNLAHHEIGHIALKASHGVIGDYATILPCKDMLGHVSGRIYAVWDLGYDWSKCGPEYDIMHAFGAICCEAIYSGNYNWPGARVDLKFAEAVAEFYSVSFDDLLDMWRRTHEILIDNWDLVEVAAEKLFIDKVLPGEWVEENLLLAR